MKLGPTGAFLYGTYMGGTGYDWAHAASRSTATGNVYVSGGATLRRGQLPADRQRLRPRAPNSYDAFLTKFDAAGTRVYSTFFGGIGRRAATGSWPAAWPSTTRAAPT